MNWIHFIKIIDNLKTLDEVQEFRTEHFNLDTCKSDLTQLQLTQLELLEAKLRIGGEK